MGKNGFMVQWSNGSMNVHKGKTIGLTIQWFNGNVWDLQLRHSCIVLKVDNGHFGAQERLVHDL